MAALSTCSAWVHETSNGAWLYKLTCNAEDLATFECSNYLLTCNVVALQRIKTCLQRLAVCPSVYSKWPTAPLLPFAVLVLINTLGQAHIAPVPHLQC